ncbi:MAG: hypothetical protein LBM98_03335 [Oscillospiraceae bacterium]|nr:hypothetical protein [Oscillospiraceae bacterium]
MDVSYVALCRGGFQTRPPGCTIYNDIAQSVRAGLKPAPTYLRNPRPNPRL